jgi:hypothetical protein
MNKIVLGLLSIAIVVLVWYLFIRPYEYSVTFTGRTLPGDIIQTVRIWDRSLENAEVIEVDSIYMLKQRISRDNREYIYSWTFDVVDDSTTRVRIKISEPNESLKNKLLIPFTDQPIERDAKNIGMEFFDVLKEHLRITRVDIRGEAEIPPTFCVCTRLKTGQVEKANGMMKDFPLLTSFVHEFKLQPVGAPLVRLNKWSHSKGTLEFEFCLPIVKADSLPKTDLITYRQFGRERALQAVYHGNYITSDRAWYELYKFAETEGYQVNGLPVEFFHNNPNAGIYETSWRAEIFLPIN